MPQSPVTLVLIGIGGMGSCYVKELLENPERGNFRIAGAVDPHPEHCPQLNDLKGMGVPVYPTLDDFYSDQSASLAVISSPIQFHCRQTCLALSKGSHVLCEKPAAATIQEVREMQAAEKTAGKPVSIGYQWSFSPAIQKLKRDIAGGAFGKPRRFKCLYLWPRDEAYYGRNDWAGKKADSKRGWILDSPANNAMAHDLHNIFYLLGREKHLSAMPFEVTAELYRANPVENFDTAAVRVTLEEGVEILFLVSHASRGTNGPLFRYEFDKATVHCTSRQSGIRAEGPEGRREEYGNPDANPMAKLWDAVEGLTRGSRTVCGLEAATSQTLCVNGAQDSMPAIKTFPKRMLHTIEESGSRRIWVDGLDEILLSCYEENLLPSEKGVSWAAAGKKISLGNYHFFPGGRKP